MPSSRIFRSARSAARPQTPADRRGSFIGLGCGAHPRLRRRFPSLRLAADPATLPKRDDPIVYGLAAARRLVRGRVDMQVEVDRNVCIGAGNCVMTVARVFDQDEEGVVVLREPDPPPDLVDLVERATQICPSAAIRIR